jgi:hydrogenase-4 transcriptional activator
MHRVTEVVLDVWREVGRHAELPESAPRLMRILQRHMPIERLVVRQIARDGDALETIVDVSRGAAPHAITARTSLTAAEARRLSAWMRTAPAQGGPLRPALADQVAPGIEGEIRATTLGVGAGSPAVLLLVARRGETFDQLARAIAAALREPMSVAMENEFRLRELVALREAAEADRTSLLARLGREALVDGVVGAETGLSSVMSRVATVAPRAVPVLVVGDTGTGKELVARSIHAASPRAAKPFHRVNCGAIAPELVDSELFGHVRGAFTGAVADRRGWFERAHGGTLFLDEVGELSPAAQVRLLTVVQDGIIERVGGHEPLHVDVRIVAATHRDLTSMVRDGRFREDLWYRLAVFTILLPPLRERVGDISDLAAHFARRAATRFGLPLRLPTANDVALLASHDWPGNVRELASVIDRAALLGGAEGLDIATALGVPRRATAIESPQMRASSRTPASQIVTFNEAARQHIESALVAARGRVEGPNGAAALLSVNPNTLRARIRRLGIDAKQFRG